MRLLFSALLVLVACGRRDPVVATPVPRAEHANYSVYDLTTMWHDQRGTPRALASLAGRPQAVALVYTHCSATCPLIVGELKRIEHTTRAGLVLVSLDPARDTPGRLAEFAATHDLDASRWTLLAGSDDDVRELAALIGVRYRRLTATDLAHTNTITLLDAAGHPVHQQATLAGTSETVRVALSMPNGRP